MFVHILYVHMYNVCTCTCMYLCRSTNLSKAEECRQSIYSLINSYILKPNEGINQIVLIALYLTIFLTTEWQMLLDLIKETVKVCPETFVSGVQHSSSPQLSKHSKSKWYALNKEQSAQRGPVFHYIPYILLIAQEVHVLLGCHDYIPACTGMQVLNICVLDIPCLRPHPIRHLHVHVFYYCAFIRGAINIRV